MPASVFDARELSTVWTDATEMRPMASDIRASSVDLGRRAWVTWGVRASPSYVSGTVLCLAKRVNVNGPLPLGSRCLGAPRSAQFGHQFLHRGRGGVEGGLLD